MENPSVIRIWITNKNNAQITAAINQSMVDFLTVAIDHGCLGSTFAEDNERIIVYTKWSDEESLEKFRSSNEYKIEESKIINSFVEAGFEIPGDILFNSTAEVLFQTDIPIK